jgi:hypothetical protein
VCSLILLYHLTSSYSYKATVIVAGASCCLVDAVAPILSSSMLPCDWQSRRRSPSSPSLFALPQAHCSNNWKSIERPKSIRHPFPRDGVAMIVSRNHASLTKTVPSLPTLPFPVQTAPAAEQLAPS